MISRTYSSLPGNEKKREIDCPLCRSPRWRRKYILERSVFVRCNECGLVYQNPMPDQTHLLERYDEDYFKYELMNENNFRDLELLALNDIRFLEEYPAPRGERFLDIGCATGLFLETMMKQGWSVKGVEVCRGSAEYGRKIRGLDITNATLDKAGFDDLSFDVVHFSHLLEHLTDPISFMKNVHKILAPHGRVILTTPNIGGLQAVLFGNNWRSLIHDHVILYDKKRLALLCRRTGFEIIRTRTWGGIAKGYGPLPLKKVLDPLSKRFGFGDVMVSILKKTATRM